MRGMRVGVVAAGAMVVGAAMSMSGCQSATVAMKESVFGIAKRDQLVARVKDVRESQQDAKVEFKDALEQFMALSGSTGSALESKYKKLNGAYEDAKDAAEDVHTRIGKVEYVSEALFREWQQEIQTYTNATFKSDSQRQLNETRGQYEQLLGVMKGVEAKMQPVLNNFREHVLYLKHNLNAQAISSLMQNESMRIQGDVQKLIAEMQASIDEADAFIRQMKS